MVSIVTVLGAVVGRGTGWLMFRPEKPPRIFGFVGMGSVVDASLRHCVGWMRVMLEMW